MCGIAGTYRLPSVSVEAALDRLAHRGPNGRGITAAGEAVHGHVRLALLDLTDASAQPFAFQGGVLSYAGEIWNYQEVRDDLERLGHAFRTTGDTEVLAAALAQWGIKDALPRLDGMYAFAWTSAEGRTYLARDRHGELPLYVYRSGGAYAWTSERKALDLPTRPLPAGTYLDLETGRSTRWYSLPVTPPAEPTARIIPLLKRGVAQRLHADAPVAVLISGGLDSALVTAIAAERTSVTAYTAVLDPKSLDLSAARRLTEELEIPLVEVPVSSPTPEALSAAARTIEIPSKAQVEIAALCIPLAAALAADGYRAVLSGEAADELFGGYGNLILKGHRADDHQWRAIRRAAFERQSRANFIRCNKSFMSHGVECRLPYLDLGLVESVITMSKADCPPAKKRLKQEAPTVLPQWVIKRVKETFQGGSGMAAAAATVVADPARYYRTVVESQYGKEATRA